MIPAEEVTSPKYDTKGAELEEEIEPPNTWLRLGQQERRLGCYGLAIRAKVGAAVLHQDPLDGAAANGAGFASNMHLDVR